MSDGIVLWGASGHAKVLHELARQLNRRIVALVDRDPNLRSPFPDALLLHGMEGFARWRAQNPQLVLDGLAAIGGSRGADRLEVHRSFREHNVQPAALVHPRAFVALSATLGPGAQVLANAAVAADARVGEACIVNTSASVDHECELDEGAHIGPGAVLAGCVRVGRCSFVGSAAVVLPRIRIGQNVVIGAGAVVTRDLPDGVVAYGNPARIAAPAGDSGIIHRTTN